jgi:hypothetical protein
LTYAQKRKVKSGSAGVFNERQSEVTRQQDFAVGTDGEGKVKGQSLSAQKKGLITPACNARAELDVTEM